MFNFVIQVGQLAMEKELRLRQAMTVAGLLDSVYWSTWLLTNLCWNFLSSCILVLSGFIFGFNFFLLNDFLLYFTLFCLFGATMVPFALFISQFVSKSTTATSLGFAMFLVGVITQGASGFVFDQATDAIYMRLFSLLPFCLLAKGMGDLGSASDNEGENGLRWRQRQTHGFFPIADVYRWLVLDFFIYLFLAMLYDQLFGGVRGESRWTQWLCSKSKIRVTANDDEDRILQVSDISTHSEDSENGSKASSVSIISLKGLKKTFFSRKWFGMRRVRKRDFTAVNGVDLDIYDKQMFCLLGHNGAGKTTTINMLTGLLQPTSGGIGVLDKPIVGNSRNLAAVRSQMGVCPQFDILWEEMTGAEHVELFCALKSVDQVHHAHACFHKKGSFYTVPSNILFRCKRRFTLV